MGRMPTDLIASPRPPLRPSFRGLRHALAALFVVCAAACASIPARDPASGCANCPVCLHNADLACVCVKVEADTPRAEWNGQTWYFCSEECKQAFLADPKRFNSSGGGR
jgi:YHS domain-containing protein